LESGTVFEIEVGRAAVGGQREQGKAQDLPQRTSLSAPE
jgi:hypothetical protein